MSWRVLTDCMWRRPASDVVDLQYLDTVTAVLNTIRCWTGSQCRLRRTGVMRSYFVAPVTRRAVAFCITSLGVCAAADHWHQPKDCYNRTDNTTYSSQQGSSYHKRTVKNIQSVMGRTRCGRILSATFFFFFLENQQTQNISPLRKAMGYGHVTAYRE